MNGKNAVIQHTGSAEIETQEPEASGNNIEKKVGYKWNEAAILAKT